ncbi:MAG: enoyl-CoA hydratase/isomerase family protein [Campylobacteraceae bacterium]|nr:enoyl-CoA hydratase/isomerase family protein [Campylobacteraceae bacterium]
MTNILLKIQNNIATLEIDCKNEKVNILSLQVLNELDEKLNEIIQNKSIKLLLIQSGKKNTFIAGADIKEIQTFKDEEEVLGLLEKGHSIFNKLENLNIPSVVYINGACMGGGLELALACTYRVISAQSKLAFPEVKLGFFPGLGGTQRAPKVMGLINALDLILSGKTIDAKKAYRIQLADAIFDEGQKEFKLKAFIKNVLNHKIKKRKTFSLLESWPLRELIFSKALKTLKRKVNKDFKGPYIALNIIKKTYQKDFKHGLELEAKEFSKLAVSKEAKYMIELFFMFEKYNKNFTKTKDPLSKVSILGCGVMGQGIIWLFSKYLKEVRIKDISLDYIQGALKKIAKLYDFALQNRSLSKTQVDFNMNKISYTKDFSGMKDIEFAIEVIFENEKVKKQAYKELEEVLNPDAIIASNTSSISIETLSQNIKNKKNFLGVHFFNPANLMPLVEVIPSSHTSKKTINRVLELLVSCGKTPIVVGDCAGFVVNRILLPYLNEAAFILKDSSSITQIDKVLKDFGMPMGPFVLADTVGIDVGYEVSKILNKAYGKRMPISDILIKLHELKLFGRKTQEGFYTYEGKNIQENQSIESMINENRKDISKNEILDRCLLIMINEAARCLEENIVQDANTINFAMITGTGFPPYKGGLLSYANDLGLEYIVKTLKKLQEEQGLRFKPCKLLLALEKNNQNFNTGDTLWKV